MNRNRTRLGALLSPSAAASSYVMAPVLVLALLQAHRTPHLVDAWAQVATTLWHRRSEARTRGGLSPHDVMSDIRVGRSRATRYAHLAELESLGLITRAPLPGAPSRGPGARITYRLTHTATPAQAHAQRSNFPETTPSLSAAQLATLRAQVTAYAAQPGNGPEHTARHVLALAAHHHVPAGHLLTPATVRAAGHVRIPTALLSLLASQGAHRLAALWASLSRYLWRTAAEQATRRGLLPCVLVAHAAPHQSRAATYRQLSALESLGLLERSRTPGHPRRGPGTRVRYWLPHALWRPRNAPPVPEAPPPPQPPSAPATLTEPARGPPAPLPPAQRRRSAHAARAVLAELKRRHG